VANALYDKGREAFLLGDIDWVADNIKLVLVDAADYTPNLATHQFLSDIPSGAREETSGNLTSKSATNGIADAADLSPAFPAATGDICEYIAIYKDTGVASTSPLIALLDTATGLPITLNGGDINVVFDNGTNKIFKL
jgi:hypothetical protein